ncbi:MAG: alpha/beta hydrolase [Candidatus Omnitrophica bacterium]|nr:alpha/beta hydrolase [Candidatus Omnitrophota bacterium]
MRSSRRFALFLFVFVPLLQGCNSYFYWPEARPPIPEAGAGSGLQIHHFVSKDDTILEGWFVPAKTLDAKGLIVYCHGTDTNIGEYYDAVEFLPYHGFDLFMFDYRGYGSSEGSPSREGTVMDTHAAIDYAKSLPQIGSNEPVALYGYSLGSGIAIVVTAERPDISGVVAESGFTTYRDIARKVTGDRWLTWALQIFSPIFVPRGKDAIDYVDKISPRPIFIVQGDCDELVPCWMADELYAKAKEPKKLWKIRGAGHYSPPDKRHPAYERRIAGYFDYIFDTANGLKPEVDPDCLPGGKTYD